MFNVNKRSLSPSFSVFLFLLLLLNKAKCLSVRGGFSGEKGKSKRKKERFCIFKSKEGEKLEMATCMNAFLFRFCCFVFFYSALVFRLIPSSSSGLRGSACNQKSNTTIEDFFFCVFNVFIRALHQSDSTQTQVTNIQISLYG